MDIKTKLQQCKTAGEMLKVIQDYYILDAPLGPMVKASFVSGLLMAVKMIQAPTKF
jgi:hypothetical protein